MLIFIPIMNGKKCKGHTGKKLTHDRIIIDVNSKNNCNNDCTSQLYLLIYISTPKENL